MNGLMTQKGKENSRRAIYLGEHFRKATFSFRAAFKGSLQEGKSDSPPQTVKPESCVRNQTYFSIEGASVFFNSR